VVRTGCDDVGHVSQHLPGLAFSLPLALTSHREAQRKLGYDELMEKLDKETISWWKNDYPKISGEFIKGWLPVVSGFLSIIFSFSLADSVSLKPRSEIWWLNILGTDPEHQRKGYASMLLNDVFNSVCFFRPFCSFYEFILLDQRSHHPCILFDNRGKCESISRSNALFRVVALTHRKISHKLSNFRRNSIEMLAFPFEVVRMFPASKVHSSSSAILVICSTRIWLCNPE